MKETSQPVAAETGVALYPVGSVIHISRGGPTHRISVNGKIVTFEDHPYCGPIAVSARTGEGLKRQTPEFLRAVTLWYEQGKRVEDGLCRWDHEQEPILRRINKSNAIVIGWKPAKRGA